MKYSRQRELIEKAVMQNPVHPTADMIYSLVRAQEPTISLGTVYRNLNLLSQQGVLRKVSIPDASDRFDGRLEHHHHILCTECGQVFDVNLGNLSQLDVQIKNIPDFTVTDYQVLIQGICGSCGRNQ